jgi:hypothetical protein
MIIKSFKMSLVVEIDIDLFNGFKKTVDLIAHISR